MRRREFILGLGAIAGAAWSARNLAAYAPLRLAASWQQAHASRVGVLRVDAPATEGLRVACALEVPTRAHGLLLERAGTLLSVARRPGDWLLRWHRAGHPLAWRWIEPRRAFCGHVLASADGLSLYTTEMDLDSGAGLVGVRDAASLEKRAEWQTHGVDPHELTWDATRHDALIVANGGVATRPETGRSKRDLEHMDSSLVRLHAAHGALLGQWRLPDHRLSLRHLAWSARRESRVLGIALQAQHEAPEARARAPVLALFDGRALRAVAADRPLAGYGGDIAAADGVFAVSCPRAQGVALQRADGAWQRLVPLAEACALAAARGRIFAGGRSAALEIDVFQDASFALPDLRVDNHWIVLEGVEPLPEPARG